VIAACTEIAFRWARHLISLKTILRAIGRTGWGQAVEAWRFAVSFSSVSLIMLSNDLYPK
jgi:hypothetical protein